jgi:hypothetical protein
MTIILLSWRRGFGPRFPVMTNENLGTWIRRRLDLFCRACNRSADFPVGVLTRDGVWEVRLCPECGATHTDHAMYWARPGEATETGIR